MDRVRRQRPRRFERMSTEQGLEGDIIADLGQTVRTSRETLQAVRAPRTHPGNGTCTEAQAAAQRELLQQTNTSLRPDRFGGGACRARGADDRSHAMRSSIRGSRPVALARARRHRPEVSTRRRCDPPRACSSFSSGRRSRGARSPSAQGSPLRRGVRGSGASAPGPTEPPVTARRRRGCEVRSHTQASSSDERQAHPATCSGEVCCLQRRLQEAPVRRSPRWSRQWLHAGEAQVGPTSVGAVDGTRGAALGVARPLAGDPGPRSRGRVGRASAWSARTREARIFG